MKFLVDAHIGWLIVRFIESQGHDVLRAATFPPATSDEEVLRKAILENRFVMTSDKDFGELVFNFGLNAKGVILLRIKVASEVERLEVIERFWPRIEAAVPDHFVTVTATRVRRRPLR